MTAAVLAWAGLLAATPQEAPATDLHRAVRDYVEVWRTGEVDRLDDLVSEDFRRSDFHGHVEGRDELRRFIRELHDVYQDFRLELHEVIVQGDVASARLEMRGGFFHTGLEVDMPIIAFYWFDEAGRIQHEFPLGDYVNYLEDLGYQIASPSETVVLPPIADELEVRPPRSEAGEAALDAARRALATSAGSASGTVAVRSPVTCRLELDGEPLGVLPAGGEVELPVSKGTHRLAARSLAGSRFFETEFEVRARQAVEVAIDPPARLIVRPRQRTAEDLTTGLMWPLADTGDDVTWQEAHDHCRALELGQHRDWRLPHIRELQTLYDESSTKTWKTLDGILLSSCCAWSSTLHDDWRAWNFISYKNGTGLQPLPLSRYQRVLCVRDVVGRPDAEPSLDLGLNFGARHYYGLNFGVRHY